MDLTNITVKNFRACRDTTVNFTPNLTVLVGENASGKSAIIDALRMATFPASGRQTTWFSADRDLTHGITVGEPVEISARYGGLSEMEKAVYLAELLDTHEDLIYTASFATDVATPRRSMMSWFVGESLAEDPEPALRRRISHVYLPPLRDAVRDLDGSDQTQLHDVLRLLLDGDHEREAQFVGVANEALKKIADHPVAKSSRNAIQSFFSRTTAPNREHFIELNQRELELRRITRLLRLQLSERDIPIGDIASTGLGYANLLYFSMIILQLAKAKESDLTLLLVEEPEAHLHPQLQLVLLAFLQDQAMESGQNNDSLQPAGKVQVVVTTHSPVLASTVKIEQIVVIARDGTVEGWSTAATSLGQLGLTNAQARKIDRYLNATRSALLFARDVILVEGIAEMLLLPSLAEYRFASLLPTPAARGPEGDADHEATPGEDQSQKTEPEVRRLIRQFSSATIVSVEGVDFEPYLRLLLSGVHPRVDRVVVITDRDHTGAGDTRKATYEALFPEDVEAGRLVVEVGGTTLEAEIFREPTNEKLLKDAFLALHPQSTAHWNTVADATKGQPPDTRAQTFAQAIRASSAKDGLYLDISKGDFAHIVAEAILTDKHRVLVVPEYLRQAIDAVAHIDQGNAEE